MKDVAESSKAPKVTPSFITSDYKIKEYIARQCCERIEDLLLSTYEEEAPAVVALQKCSQGTQTERSGSKRGSKENERLGDTPDSM
nr:unnamed protein product [Callosobruchus chinensis]